MNHQEAVGLCRIVKAVCPHQAIDEATPDMWGPVLAHIRFVDAKEAIVNLARTSPFISPAEIVAEVKRIRAKRLADHPEPTPPDDLTPVETIEWLRATRAAIADGNPPEVLAVDAKPRPVCEALARTFRQPEDA